MKVGIVRLSSLGDIIFCMASLQVIKRARPDCSLTWFADSKFADILDHNPDLDQVVKLDLKGLKKNFSWTGLAREYGKVTGLERCDLAIDLHGMLKSAVVTRMVGRQTFGLHRSVAKERLSSFCYDKSFAPPQQHLPPYRYALLAAQALGITVREEELMDKRPFLFYAPEDLRSVEGYFSRDRKNVLVVPGTSHSSKNMPLELLAGIVKGLDAHVLLCHGNDQELKTVRGIAESSPDVMVLPRLNLNQLKAAVGRCDLVIGGDTGPTHIAWACDIPSVGVFGPTGPCTHPGPLHRHVLPSGGVGRPMQEIDVADVLRGAEALLTR